MAVFSKKELYFPEFSKTMVAGENQYLSFYTDKTAIEEFDILFDKLMESYGRRHLPIYRMCDAEYMYCVGRQVPDTLSWSGKMKYRLKTTLVNRGLVKQRTGHVNKVNGEVWFGETYSPKEQAQLKEKYLNDLKIVAAQGFLAPHLVYSVSRFAEEYIDPMFDFFKQNKIIITKDNYFPFYFVYVMLSLERYKRKLLEGKRVLVVTAFNERNKQENFRENFAKENVAELTFYNISHDKSMLDVIDRTKLPEDVDLVLIGAGIGSVNIMNQLGHLNALCVDAGHVLDCFSRPNLRLERMCLLPDVETGK
ncbi:MAG: hypothetical protein ABW007_12465 [Chitinophagaceae bacterium]